LVASAGVATKQANRGTIRVNSALASVSFSRARIMANPTNPPRPADKKKWSWRIFFLMTIATIAMIFAFLFIANPVWMIAAMTLIVIATTLIWNTCRKHY
jgi:hypothetical protein